MGETLDALKTVARYWIGVPLLAIGLIAPGNALADKPVDLHFIGGLALGYSNFEFPAKLDHDLTFPVYQLHGGIAYKRFYVVANLADSFSDAEVSEEEDIGEASRYDRDISLGYQLTPVWGVFAGYKTGKTTIDYQSREDLDEGGPAPVREEYYEQEGPFLGISYTKKFERAGRLSLSLAYADLDASNRFVRDADDDDDDDEKPEFDDLTGTVSGDSTGLALGIRWSIPVSGNLLYYMSFRVNDYQQDLSIDGNRYDNIDEKITYLTTGLFAVF